MPEKPAPNEDKPPPKCKAILLCESIMREEGTRKVSLIRLINVQVLAEFPGRTNPMRIFLHLVDGIGNYDTTIEIHDLEEDHIIARGKGRKIRFPDRLSSVEPIFVLPPLPITHPGRYDVVVLGNGQEIDRQQVLVRHAGDEGETK